MADIEGVRPPNEPTPIEGPAKDPLDVVQPDIPDPDQPFHFSPEALEILDQEHFERYGMPGGGRFLERLANAVLYGYDPDPPR